MWCSSSQVDHPMAKAHHTANIVISQLHMSITCHQRWYCLKMHIMSLLPFV